MILERRSIQMRVMMSINLDKLLLVMMNQLQHRTTLFH